MSLNQQLLVYQQRENKSQKLPFYLEAEFIPSSSNSNFIVTGYVDNNVVLLNVGVVQKVERIMRHMFIFRI